MTKMMIDWNVVDANMPAQLCNSSAADPYNNYWMKYNQHIDKRNESDKSLHERTERLRTSIRASKHLTLKAGEMLDACYFKWGVQLLCHHFEIQGKLTTR